jgi:hypothetical protein
MSTLAEIESAVERLPARQKEELLAFIARQLGRAPATRARTRRGLKAAGRPALEGLPADLSTGTKERLRALDALQARLALDAGKADAWTAAVRDARR